MQPPEQPVSLDRRVRVLSVIKGLGLGGAERLLVDQLANRDEVRFENHVAYLLPSKDLLADAVRATGVDVTCLGEPRGLPGVWLARLGRLMRSFEPDVLHVHSPFMAALIRPWLRVGRSETALVYTEHNRWAQYRPATRVANRLTYGLDDARICVSAGVADSLSQRAAADAHVIRNGIDVEAVRGSADRVGVRQELGLSEDTVVIMIVANVRAEKDYPNLIDAAALVLASSGEDVVFVAVGDGPLRQEMQARVRDAGIADRFRMLGLREDAVRLVSAADLFVLSSAHEGLPLALLEAMALGVPAVATAVGGIPEAIEHDVSGLLVPPHDSAALARSIGVLVDDPVRRAGLARDAATKAEDFGVRPAVARLESIYLDLVGAR